MGEEYEKGKERERERERKLSSMGEDKLKLGLISGKGRNTKAVLL